MKSNIVVEHVVLVRNVTEKKKKKLTVQCLKCCPTAGILILLKTP